MTRPLSWLHAFVDVPAEAAEPAARFWAAASGSVIGSPWSDHPEFRSLEPATGSRYLHVQRHGGRPRLHLDLTTPDVDAETARAVDLGATAGSRERWWQVLSSPGGLPFCLVEETPDRSRPDSVRWPGGHRSRVAQLVLDVPAARYPAESAFWRAITDWPLLDGRLQPPDTAPLPLLVHPVADEAGPVRAHLDIGTDDIGAEARRLVELGAEAADDPGHEGSRVVLRDPVGLPVCVIPGAGR